MTIAKTQAEEPNGYLLEPGQWTKLPGAPLWLRNRTDAPYWLPVDDNGAIAWAEGPIESSSTDPYESGPYAPDEDDLDE